MFAVRRVGHGCEEAAVTAEDGLLGEGGAGERVDVDGVVLGSYSDLDDDNLTSTYELVWEGGRRSKGREIDRYLTSVDTDGYTSWLELDGSGGADLLALEDDDGVEGDHHRNVLSLRYRNALRL